MSAFPQTGTNEEWGTPPDVFAALNDEFGFNLDPAAAEWNHKCEDYFTKREDGLAQQWYGSVFMNPPYGRPIKRWIEKAWSEWVKVAEEQSRRSSVDVVVGLLPARTDPQWFHKFIVGKAEIRFLPGRLYFMNPDGSQGGRSPWGSMVVVWGGEPGAASAWSEQ